LTKPTQRACAASFTFVSPSLADLWVLFARTASLTIAELQQGISDIIGGPISEWQVKKVVKDLRARVAAPKLRNNARVQATDNLAECVATLAKIQASIEKYNFQPCDVYNADEFTSVQRTDAKSGLAEVVVSPQRRLGEKIARSALGMLGSLGCHLYSMCSPTVGPAPTGPSLFWCAQTPWEMCCRTLFYSRTTKTEQAVT
jgi:hypothetical protein